MQQNMNVAGFELDKDDMAALDRCGDGDAAG
jgi:diketogulonate reductase-like aldo/keto reductase